MRRNVVYVRHEGERQVIAPTTAECQAAIWHTWDYYNCLNKAKYIRSNYLLCGVHSKKDRQSVFA